MRNQEGDSESPFDPSQRYDLAPIIDHTLLKAEATAEQVDRLCDEALAFRFASVCVNPAWVRQAVQRLAGSGVRVCTVAGFPLGATTAAQKAHEAAAALEDGAEEVDMVLAIGLARAGAWRAVRAEMDAVRSAVPKGHAVLKVILETCHLDGEQKAEACRAALDAGLDFVKTSTGFGPGGATAEDVALMRGVVGDAMGVKASGGIRDYEGAIRMVQAGATRLGLSASVAVARGTGLATSGY
ncbi:MAG: deoxyribose-phosphate aldolase [Acidobacteria bacterium]|nr:deoxyribose-phosphate aldolase [Acidobacteriota bacterium]